MSGAAAALCLCRDGLTGIIPPPASAADPLKSGITIHGEGWGHPAPNFHDDYPSDGGITAAVLRIHGNVRYGGSEPLNTGFIEQRRGLFRWLNVPATC